MSKEMIEKSKEWLANMNKILSRQTDEESRIHVKERIEIQAWLIEQAERMEDNDQAIIDLNKHVEELEDENVDLKAIKAGNEYLVEKLEQQNRRYREAFKQIALQILFDGALEDHRKNIIEIIDEALEEEPE